MITNLLALQLNFNIVYKIKNNELSIINRNNTKSRSRIKFWNKNTNRSDLDIEKNRDNNKDKNEVKKSKIEKIVSLDVLKLEIK